MVLFVEITHESVSKEQDIRLATCSQKVQKKKVLRIIHATFVSGGSYGKEKRKTSERNYI